MVLTSVRNNFSSGLASPRVAGRYDLKKAYANALQECLNFIPLPQGPASYRNGFVHSFHTRNHQPAVFIPFQFNDSQAYLIEATDGYFRFLKDEGIITETAQNITAATQANPVVITIAGHNYEDGEEVFIEAVVGMTELNGKFYKVQNKTANTFEITDSHDVDVDGTAFTAYTSGGTAARVYELKVPYEADYLEDLQFDQEADLMYITHRRYNPRKLTRTGHAAWTLTTYTRTADPFYAPVAITGITQANPAVATSVGHGLTTGDQIYLTGIAGMTELNDAHYLVNVLGANTYELQDLLGVDIDSTGFGAWSSGGESEELDHPDNPRAIAFTDDTRQIMAETANKPNVIWFSMGPDTSTGVTRFDTYTKGTSASDGLEWALASVQGKSDSIRWVSSTDKFLTVGTFATVRRFFGATEAEPVTPTSVNAKPVSEFGVSLARPVPKGGILFFVGRDRRILRSMEFDFEESGFTTVDRNLISQEIGDPFFKRLVYSIGRPDSLWAVMDDGQLYGLAYYPREDISGWHRHKVAGNGLVESIGVMPRTNGRDQVWIIVKRTINGKTTRYIEFGEDETVFPQRTQYFTDRDNETADDTAYRNYLYEQQKRSNHLDSSLVYDGYNTSGALTLSALTGAGVTFTSSASFFSSDMVGREIWGRYASDGTGGGRAEIKTYVSPTEVTCDIIVDFVSLAITATNWALTAGSLSGLDHLEGETVGILTDGAEHPQKTVTSGAITIDYQASYIIVGLKYPGIAAPMDLEFGATPQGTAFSSLKDVQFAHLRLLNSGSVRVGASPYNTEHLIHFKPGALGDRPAPLATGIERVRISDTMKRGKTVYVVKDTPTPCTLLHIETFGDVADVV